MAPRSSSGPDSAPRAGRSGFIAPSIQRAEGKGSDRRYAFHDLVTLRVAQQLRDAGISLQSLRKVVDHLQQRKDLDAPPAALSSTFLLSDGTDVFEKRAEDALVSVLRKPGQGALFLVPLYEVVEELREKIARAA